MNTNEQKSFIAFIKQNKAAFVITVIALALIVVSVLALNFFKTEAAKYDISFVSNGGSSVEAVIVEQNNKIIRPKDPVKEGYRFKGWYYNGEPYDFNNKITENIKLEAKWEKIEKVSSVELDQTTLILYVNDTTTLNATVIPENAENKNVTWKSSNPKTVSVDEAGNITALKEGNATITVTTEDGGHTAEVKILARIAIVGNSSTGSETTTSKPSTSKYKVSFVDTDGSNLFASQTITHGNMATEPSVPTKEGYTFLGWYNGKTKFRFTQAIKSNLTLTAKWIKNNYTITFVNYDGTVIETQTVEYGEMPTCTILPTKPSTEINSYTFASWAPNVKVAKEDATYTATFTEGPRLYEIVFKDTDGTTLSATQTVLVGNLATEPKSPSKEGHAFIAWYNGDTKYSFEQAVTSDLTLTAKWDISKHTITFVNYDDTVLDTQTVEYGTIPTYNGIIPTKPDDKMYTYMFEGWDKELTATKNDTIYYAKYTQTYVDYIVTFVNYDGTVISKDIYHFGDKVVVPDTPTKPATDEYTYTFAGWDKEISSVKNNATYTATYSKKINSYDITFVDTDDSTLDKTQTIEYGKKVAKPEEPIKEGHTFLGWYNNDTKYTFDEVVKSNLTLTAKWEINKYEITFVNYDGTILDIQTVEYGTLPTYTKDMPSKPANDSQSYAFIGWTPAITVAKENTTYTATFSETFVDYIVTFVNYDGTVISKKTYHFGDTVVVPSAPTKPGTDEFSFTFAGWDKEIDTVKGNTTYTATYSQKLNSYVVTFVDTDGSTLEKAQTIEYGKKAIIPAEPIKEGYTFVGWYNNNTKYTFEEAVKSNLTLTAKWEINKYEITFVNHDGTVLETQTVEHGTTPKYTGATPTKAPSQIYSYVFAGWDKQLVAIKGNTTYTATYNEKYIEYTITFVNYDGTILDEKVYHYGDTVVVPSAPTKPETDEFSFTFAGWDKEIDTVKGNTTYTATYSQKLNSYVVTFVDTDGSTLEKTQTIEYGKKASKPAEPSKEGHTFVGWYNNNTKYTFEEAVKSNLTLTAKWEAAKYTVTFVNHDGTVLETQTVEHGTTPKYTGATPTKAPTQTYSYVFAGWDKQLVAIKGNTTYTATYNEKYIEYTITFKNYDGTILDEKVYHYGDTVVVPSAPTRSATAEYTFTFAGWDKEIDTVKGNTTYTATYSQKLNSYVVTFVDTDGSTLEKAQTIEYGKKASKPSEPSKEGHTFVGWYNNNTKYTFEEAVKSNLTLTAKWETAKYTITFVNYNGDVLETKTVEHGTTPKYTGTTPTKPNDGTNSYKFVGWNKVITVANGNTTYTAVYKYCINLDSAIQNDISEANNFKQFRIEKNGSNLKLLFTKYRNKKPPYAFIDIFFDVAEFLDILSYNELYKSVELYYAKPGDDTGRTIDLKAHDLSNTDFNLWYGDGANAVVTRWLGYVALGEASTAVAIEANTDHLVNKSVKVTFTLKDGYVNTDGKTSAAYNLTFVNE